MRAVYARAIAALVGCLRLGQPPVAPATGYSPLLALMPRRLTDAEIRIMARHFTQPDAAASDFDIAVAIMTITDDLATDIDVGRVRRSLPSTE